jgi:NADH dehydrogenase
VDVTLVDQRNFHTFQPLLYEVATAGLDPGDVAYPVRAVVGRIPNINFHLGTVTGVDWNDRVVCFAGLHAKHDSASAACADDLPFDSLIVASGAVVNFFGVPGAAEHAFPLYTLDDARQLRDHILLRLEEADGEAAHASDGTLNFVVVGGGPTGVEVSGAIAELLDMSMERDGFRIDRSMARIVLIDGLNQLLTPFKPSAQRYAAYTLKHRTVELILGAMVAKITPSEVELKDGFVIASRTVIWAGGVTVNGTAASGLGTPTLRNGRLVVGSDLTVLGQESVFAIGDAAAIPTQPGSDQVCPQLAQVAIQSGRHAAQQIIAQVSGEPLMPFYYRNKGIMATIGRRAAVAQLPDGFVLRGTLGWVAWFGLHLVYLIGFRNRVTVLVNWTWRYLSWTSGPRVIIGAQPERTSGPDDPVRT